MEVSVEFHGIGDALSLTRRHEAEEGRSSEVTRQ
jgi:hypothetical protein